MTKRKCAAINFGMVLESYSREYKGRVLPKVLRPTFGRMCDYAGKFEMTRDNLTFNVCGVHNTSTSCVIREMGKSSDPTPELPFGAGVTVNVTGNEHTLTIPEEGPAMTTNPFPIPEEAFTHTVCEAKTKNKAHNYVCQRTDIIVWVPYVICTFHNNLSNKGTMLEFNSDEVIAREQARRDLAKANESNTVNTNIHEEKDIVLTNIPTEQEIALLGEIIDKEAIGRRANTLYGTNFRIDWVWISDGPEDAEDDALPGFIKCGGDYLGRLVKKGSEFFIIFDRGEEEVISNAEQFQKGVEADPLPTEEDSKALTLQSEQGEGVYPNLGETKWLMVTGPREGVAYEPVMATMRDLLRRAKEKFGSVVAVAGGAKGADFAWAKSTKQEELPLWLQIPHPGYYDQYTPVPQNTWDNMLAYAESTAGVHYTVTTGRFHYTHNFQRNRDMILKANVHIVVSKAHPKQLAASYRARRIRGGTANCCMQMQDCGVEKVIWINSVTGEEKWVSIR